MKSVSLINLGTGTSSFLLRYPTLFSTLPFLCKSLHNKGNVEKKTEVPFIVNEESIDKTVCKKYRLSFSFGIVCYHAYPGDEKSSDAQQVDGHEARIMPSFLFEDDGRGLIVWDEYVQSDDLKYAAAEQQRRSPDIHYG